MNWRLRARHRRGAVVDAPFSAWPHRLAGLLLQDAAYRRLAGAAEHAHRRGRYARAARLYHQALELAERYGAEDRWWGATYTRLALAYSRLAKYVEAEALHRRALEIYQKAEHLEQPRIATCLSNLGAIAYRQGRYAEADAFYQRALTLQEAVLGPAHPELACDLNNLATLRTQQRRYADAEPLVRRALGIQEQALGSEHPELAAALGNLAFLCQEQGRCSEAEALLERALSLVQRARGRAHPETALYLNNLACCYAEQGRDDDAEPLFRRALALRRKTLGRWHLDVATSLENYAALLESMLRNDEAGRLLQQAKAIRARHAEELLTRRWGALPLAADPGAEADPPEWVTRLSAAVAGSPGEQPVNTGSVDGDRIGGRRLAFGGPPSRSEPVAESGYPPQVGVPRADSRERVPAAGGCAASRWPASADVSLPSFSPAAELGEKDLRRALERNELQVYFQPIFSLTTGQITGAEALLRWQHPRRGLLSPRDFVPLAEETGLIRTIGERLLRDACAQRAVWSEAGHPDLRLCVNLSQREFEDARLPALIQDVLRATATPASALQLDIPERLALQDVEFSIPALQALAATGVRLALDDAGTDPALLGHLERLPIHALKLHGTLVRALTTDPQSAGAIEAMTALAHGLNLAVIALGVETEAQLALVRAQQCDEVQGYLFRRAAPAELFAMLLQKEEFLMSELLMEEHLALEEQPPTGVAASSSG